MSHLHAQMAHRKVLLALASIPSIDCVLNQVNNAFHVTLGPLSLLQVFRGAMVIALMTMFVWNCLSSASAIRRVPIPAVLSLIVLATVASKEVIATGSIAMESAVPYLQMTYWLLYWIVFTLLCEESRQAELMLKGLAAGALLTAVSVFAGFFFGGLNFYEDDAVKSSAGWFDTAKMITGDLVVGGICLLYLGRGKRSYLAAILALVCFSACIATYARAGAVALGAVILWLCFWWSTLASRERRRWLTQFLALCLGAVLVIPAVVPPQTLFARWSDLGDSDKAGSGRATFWNDAVDIYAAGTPYQQVLGRGYASMSTSLFALYGYDIKHTHNDFLDMLVVAGLLGVLWLLIFLGNLAYKALSLSPSTYEGAAAIAIVLAYVCHSQLTGQIWGTDAMSYYVLSLTSIFIAGASRTTYAESLQINAAGLESVPA